MSGRKSWWAASTAALLALAGAWAPPTAHGQGSSGALPEARIDHRAEFDQRLAIAHRYYGIGGVVRASALPPLWLPEGERAIIWSPVGPDASELVMVEARTGRSRVLASAEELRARLAQLSGRPVALPGNLALALAPEPGAILFAIGGEAYRLTLATRHIDRVQAGNPAGQLLAGAVLAPGGRRIASIRDGALEIAALNGAPPVVIEGAPLHGWRLSPRAWSPDGRTLVATRADERGMHRIPIVTYDAIESVSMQPYAKSGTPVLQVQHYLVDPETGRTTPVTLPRQEGYDFVTGWTASGREALVTRMTRDGKQLDLWAIDRTSGASRLVIRERNEATYVAALQFYAIEWPYQVTPLAGDAGFLWLSERDGWRGLYLHGPDGALQRRLTPDGITVHQVLHVGAAGDVYFLGSQEGEAPYDQLLFRARPQGGVERMSAQGGMHELLFSPSGRYVLDSHSGYDRPKTIDLVTVGTGQRRTVARADVSGLAGIGYTPPETFAATAADGQTEIRGLIFRPRDFDPRRRYPVINYVYAGPWTPVLQRGHVASHLWPGSFMTIEAHAMAQMGFLVVLVDGRGTPGRGKAFLDVTYGRIGELEIADQMAAVRQAAASRPYMDIDRVGIYGGSWGGYFALRGMLTAPDFYRAGYAGAPGALEEGAIVNEPNMGLPADNPEGYARGSNMALAANLRGPLKLMHGTHDVNASISSTMRMAEALIRAGRHFELLIMPGQPHGPVPPFDLYYFDDKMLFFWRHLGRPSAVGSGGGDAAAGSRS